MYRLEQVEMRYVQSEAFIFFFERFFVLKFFWWKLSFCDGFARFVDKFLAF